MRSFRGSGNAYDLGGGRWPLSEWQGDDGYPLMNGWLDPNGNEDLYGDDSKEKDELIGGNNVLKGQ